MTLYIFKEILEGEDGDALYVCRKVLVSWLWKPKTVKLACGTLGY
jgi:hypothetical protein